MVAKPPPPLIAVTMGDPAGVGPEVCLRLLARKSAAGGGGGARNYTPVVFGDAGVLRQAAEACGLPPPGEVIPAEEWTARRGGLTAPAVLDIGAIDAGAFTPGQVDADCGRASYRYIERAIEAALAGEVAAVTTGPINKEAIRAAGVEEPGHTEIFARKTGAARACMLQYSEEVCCSFVTVHVGYLEVPGLLTPGRILDVIELSAAALARIRGREPTVGVCGLNPHAGEHGLFGAREEERIIAPAIEAARAKGISVEGPLPPDTAFIPAARRRLDVVVCMYHDQGHIPLKALAFDKAVNVTLGLPVVRTSVDHGTAFDIAYTGQANPGSLFAAVQLAARLA